MYDIETKYPHMFILMYENGYHYFWATPIRISGRDTPIGMITVFYSLTDYIEAGGEYEILNTIDQKYILKMRVENIFTTQYNRLMLDE